MEMRTIFAWCAACLALIASAYAATTAYVHARPISGSDSTIANACADESAKQGGNPHTFLFISCGGFLD